MLTHSIEFRNNILTMSRIVVCFFAVCGQLMVHGYCSDHLRDHHRHHRDRYYGTNRCHHNQLWLLVQQPQQRQCSKSPNFPWSIRAGCTNHDPIRGSIPHQVYGIPKRSEVSINSRTRDVSLMMVMDPSTDLSDLLLSIPTMVTTTGATSVTSSSSSSTSALSNMVTTSMAQSTNDEVEMLSKETTVVVFIIGVIPFIIATYEFWRRIAIGATFGTGNDSIQFPNNNNRTTIITTTIGEDDAPLSSRGKQVLGSDSLITAYFIFATVAVVLMLVFYSILTSPIPG
jgi:hypothetical protein